MYRHSMNREFSLAFTESVKQIPGQLFPPDRQWTTNHTFLITEGVERLRSDSPFPPGVSLDESLLIEGRLDGLIGTFEAEVNEELGRLTVEHEDWWAWLPDWNEAFWPPHVEWDSVPMSAYVARDKFGVDSTTIPGYGPMLEHPMEPIMGMENHGRYLGSAKVQRLAEGFRSIKGSDQEAQYLEDLKLLPNRGERMRTRYLFLRDGTLATAEIGGIILFTDIEWYERSAQ